MGGISGEEGLIVDCPFGVKGCATVAGDLLANHMASWSLLHPSGHREHGMNMDCRLPN